MRSMCEWGYHILIVVIFIHFPCTGAGESSRWESIVFTATSSLIFWLLLAHACPSEFEYHAMLCPPPSCAGTQESKQATLGEQKLLHPARRAYPFCHEVPGWVSASPPWPRPMTTRHFSSLQGCHHSSSPPKLIQQPKAWIPTMQTSQWDRKKVHSTKTIYQVPPKVTQHLGTNLPAAEGVPGECMLRMGPLTLQLNYTLETEIGINFENIFWARHLKIGIFAVSFFGKWFFEPSEKLHEPTMNSDGHSLKQRPNDSVCIHILIRKHLRIYFECTPKSVSRTINITVSTVNFYETPLKIYHSLLSECTHMLYSWYGMYSVLYLFMVGAWSFSLDSQKSFSKETDIKNTYFQVSCPKNIFEVYAFATNILFLHA